MSDYETIPVFPKTKKRVDEFGKKGETYDTVVNAICDLAEQTQQESSDKKKVAAPGVSPR